MRRRWARRVKDYTGMMQLSCDIKPNRSVVMFSLIKKWMSLNL